ncbi:MAG: ABC transporter permease subunit [Thermaerobacter sp.]|jgi:phosphate transport system permease protein|nr:ABC transporter permease subunit [Thermaerobacter sp.]
MRRLKARLFAGGVALGAALVAALAAALVAGRLAAGWGPLWAGDFPRRELAGTLYVLGLSLVLTLPPAVGTGAFLAEYARGRGRALRLALEAMSSLPGVTVGLFGMAVFVEGLHLGFTVLGGAASLALLNLPLLAQVSWRALEGLPGGLREGSLALGVGRSAALDRLLFPRILPELATGLAVAAGRALGEAAVLAFTGGLGTGARFSLDPLAPGGTLAVYLWYLQGEGHADGRAAAATAAVLILLMLAWNLAVGLPARLWAARRGKE